MKIYFQIFLVMIFLLFSFSVNAGDIYPFHSEKKKAQFYRLTHQLRCLVCQNEDIADSGASLAANLRQIVYTKVKQGKTDQAIKEYMVRRYGDFVLFKPPLIWHTYLLWFSPFLLLLLGIWTLWGVTKKYATRHTAQTEDESLFLSEEEKRRLKDLLNR